jgi:hypothetical protein
MLVAEQGGPTMFARIGNHGALNIDKPSCVPRKKVAKKYRIVRQIM